MVISTNILYHQMSVASPEDADYIDVEKLLIAPKMTEESSSIDIAASVDMSRIKARIEALRELFKIYFRCAGLGYLYI